MFWCVSRAYNQFSYSACACLINNWIDTVWIQCACVSSLSLSLCKYGVRAVVHCFWIRWYKNWFFPSRYANSIKQTITGHQASIPKSLIPKGGNGRCHAMAKATIVTWRNGRVTASTGKINAAAHSSVDMCLCWRLGFANRAKLSLVCRSTDRKTHQNQHNTMESSVKKSAVSWKWRNFAQANNT